MPLSTFLDGRTPTRLRGLLWLSLSDIGKVGTRSSTSDTGGGVTETWSYGSDIPCRIDPFGTGGQDEDIVASRISDRTTHVITVPPNTAATTNQRFSITNRGTFEITAVRTRTGEWARRLEAVQVS